MAALCVAALSWGVMTASPASARATASMSLSPAHGSGSTTFSALFRVSGTAVNCFGGQVDFAWDGQPISAAPLDQASCTATAVMQVPLGAQPGQHKVKGSLTGGSGTATASATFTVDQVTPPSSSSSATQPSSSSSSSPTSPTSPVWSNTITPTTPWNPPPFAPQQLPSTSGPCDTHGPHATASANDVMVIPAYAAGAHAAATGSTLVSEPLAGRLPIVAVGPAAMTPPRLGVDPYRNLEVLEPIDPAISPKLRLAAAAGEPFGCLQVEVFGAPGSGYGYLVYALKGATVVSALDANSDGSPFVVPSQGPTTPSPSAKGAKPVPPPPVPKAKYERLVLGYVSLAWEYQETVGGAQAPLHRGLGTIVPPPPAAPLSYSNLVFAFGGLVAATVALMFAYHSRRRDLARRERRRASHA